MNTGIVKYTKGLLAITALFALASCGQPKDLKFGLIRNVSVKNLGLSGVDLQATVPIENPNGYNVTFKDGDVNVLSDDEPIARIKQNLPVSLPGNSKADYTVDVSIDLLHKGEIFSLMKLFNGNSNLNLDGNIKVKRFLFTKDVIVHQTAVQSYLKPVMDKMKPF